MAMEFLAGWSVNLNREERNGLIKFIRRHRSNVVASELLIGSVPSEGLFIASFVVEITTTTTTKRYGVTTDAHFVVGSGLVNPFTEKVRVQFDPEELLKALLRPRGEVRLALNQAETDLIIGDNANSRTLHLVPVVVMTTV
jgi:hypothetical protein